MFKILQWNCKGLLSKYAEISILIRKYHVICLQETWLNCNNRISFKDFSVFRNDRPLPRTGGGGSMILCRDRLDPIRLNAERLIVTGCELTVVSLKINKRKPERIIVASFYKPSDVKLNYRQWHLLFEGISSLANQSQIVILGDFNAQSEAWGSSKSNSSGEALSRYLADSCFRFLNDGSGTRVSAAPNYNSVPDLTFTNSSKLDFDWRVSGDPLGSDHLPVEMTLSERIAIDNDRRSRIENDNVKRSKLSLKNFDRKIFPLLVQSGVDSLSLDNEGVDPLQSWYNSIMLCLLKVRAVLYDRLGNRTDFRNGKIHTTPMKKSTKSKQEVIPNSPWWDGECERLVVKRKRAYKKLANCPSRENLVNYRNISGQTRKGLQKRKRENFRDFVNDLNLASGLLKFWNTVKRFKNSHLLKNSTEVNLSRQADISSYIKTSTSGVNAQNVCLQG